MPCECKASPQLANIRRLLILDVRSGASCSRSTTIDDGRLEVELDLTGARASSLKSLDDIHALLVCNLAEDDVLAIEPGGDDGGDEELRAVAVMC